MEIFAGDKLVSVIIPVLNEEKFIKECLESLYSQDYGRPNIEILVVDGGSMDKSIELAEEFASRSGMAVKILNNTEKITSKGLNIGIRNAAGRYFAILCGHSFLDPAYISVCVTLLAEKDADMAGGRIVMMSDSYVGKAIGVARSSFIGGSILSHRYAACGAFSSTAPCGVYKREVFDDAGLFDEELIHNQDEELNWRLIKKGFKIYCEPSAIIYYRQRRNLAGLARQLFRYGFWKTRTIKKYPDFFRISFGAPAVFIILTALLIIAGLFNSLFFYIMAVLIICYLSTVIFFSLWVSFRKGVKYIFILPFIYCIIHVSAGLGFLTGILTNDKR